MSIAERWASYPNSPELLFVSLIIFGVASQNLIRLEFFRKSKRWSNGRLPRRKLDFEKRQVGSMRQKFVDLVWLASSCLEITYAGDIMAVNLKLFATFGVFGRHKGLGRRPTNRLRASSLRTALLERDACG